MLARRAAIVAYESVRAGREKIWCEKIAQGYAKRIRARRGKLDDMWHLDEVCRKISGRLK